MGGVFGGGYIRRGGEGGNIYREHVKHTTTTTTTTPHGERERDGEMREKAVKYVT